MSSSPSDQHEHEVTEYHVTIHEENGMLWGEVDELPGCFASGRDLAELEEAAIEAISMYLHEGEGEGGAGAAPPKPMRVDEMRLVPA
jgi:predicted RNase H-like HicB family nuclease